MSACQSWLVGVEALDAKVLMGYQFHVGAQAQLNYQPNVASLTDMKGSAAALRRVIHAECNTLKSAHMSDEASATNILHYKLPGSSSNIIACELLPVMFLLSCLKYIRVDCGSVLALPE